MLDAAQKQTRSQLVASAPSVLSVLNVLSVLSVLSMLIVLIALSGCTSTSLIELRERSSASADGSVAATRALAGAASASASEDVYAPIDTIELVAPRLESWPRCMRGDGPYYVLAQAAPYVGQFGAVADGERAGDGSGFGVIVGRRTPRGLSKTMGVELAFEVSDHFNEHSHVDAAATRAGVGLAWSFSPMKKIQPFVAAGAGYYTLEFEGMDEVYNIAGAGAYLGMGLDAALSKHFAVRIDVRAHAWAAEDGSGAGGWTQTAVVALGIQTAF